jgi:Tol biopolymer transport system component
LWTLSPEDKNKPKLFYDAKFNQAGSVFSPDGKWIAYASQEVGGAAQWGIYVQPFPPTGAKYQISDTGGVWPIWSPNGNELFYRLNTAMNVANLKAVRITTNPVLAFSSESTLPIRDFLVFINYRDYDIMPNGREFLMVFPGNQITSSETPRPQIDVVLNWLEELKQRVPVK